MVIDQSGKELKHVWHRDDFESWCSQLATYSERQHGDERFCANRIEAALTEYANNSDGWIKSSFIPGKDWNGTPFQPLYDCLGDGGDDTQWDVARKFFGLYVCHVLMKSAAEIGTWEAHPKLDKEDGMLYRRR